MSGPRLGIRAWALLLGQPLARVLPDIQTSSSCNPTKLDCQDVCLQEARIFLFSDLVVSTGHRLSHERRVKLSWSVEQSSQIARDHLLTILELAVL
jgi:hypothetical protein